MRLSLALFLALALAAPLEAQTRPSTVGSDDEPAVSFRPFFLGAAQRLAASNTFKAVFGRSVQPFWGGGLQVAFGSGIYVEIGASRFKKAGQRAFVNNGQAFPLGIPLTATITPVDVTAGYRFRVSPRVLPYAGVGVSHYAYTETSDFADAGENVDATHTGFLFVGGVELRVHRWVGIGVDAQYTHVQGILGSGGVSKDLGENDLGGTALRVKVLVGR